MSEVSGTPHDRLATLSAGLVKYYAAASVAALFAQINLAAARAPGGPRA